MRYCLLLLIPLFAGCADKSMTRNFSMSRDSAPENMAATQMPLSMPPDAFVPSRPDTEATEQAAGSSGQDALLQAAGPAASPDIRAEINQNAGLVYPDPGFIDQLMNWTPPPGYTPVITLGSKGGWFSRMF